MINKMKIKPTISLCMVVKNEELLLGKCLEIFKPAVDEIIVVDIGSTDRTIDIAKKFNAKIIQYDKRCGCGRPANIALENATSSWILPMNADEMISKGDLRKLKKVIRSDPKTMGYVFSIRNYSRGDDLLQKWYPNDGRYPEEEKFSQCPGWSLMKRLRLFQKSSGFCYQEGVSFHAYYSPSPEEYKGKLQEVDITIHHFQYRKGDKFVAKKQNNYLRRELEQIKLFPNNSWSYLNIAITFFRAGNNDKAIKYLRKALKINAEFKDAYFLLGMVYKEKENYKKAALNLKKVIEINPEHADALVVLGIVYDIQEKFSKAESVLKKAIKLRPKHPLAHNSLGVVYENQRKFIQAEKEYKKAIKIYPNHPYACQNLDMLYKMKGKIKSDEKNENPR